MNCIWCEDKGFHVNYKGVGSLCDCKVGQPFIASGVKFSFRVGETVKVQSKHVELWQKSKYCKQASGLHITSIDSVSCEDSKYYVTYHIAETKNGPFGGTWFESEEVKISDTITITTKKPNDSTPWGTKHHLKTLAVHRCLWCREPVKKRVYGEFKGHWEHIIPQDFTSNTWSCNTSRTKDGYPHICAIDVTFKVQDTWTAEPNDESVLVRPTRRKFKEI